MTYRKLRLILWSLLYGILATVNRRKKSLLCCNHVTCKQKKQRYYYQQVFALNFDVFYTFNLIVSLFILFKISNHAIFFISFIWSLKDLQILQTIIMIPETSITEIYLKRLSWKLIIPFSLRFSKKIASNFCGASCMSAINADNLRGAPYSPREVLI